MNLMYDYVMSFFFSVSLSKKKGERKKEKGRKYCIKKGEKFKSVFPRSFELNLKANKKVENL